MITLEEMRLL